MNAIIHNRFFEFNFVLFPIWIVLAYFSLNALIDSKELTFLLFLMLFGETHFASTILFYLEKENHSYIRSNRKTLISIPLAIVAVYVLIGIFDFRTAVLLGAIASGFHVTRQSVGIQRLYGKERKRFFEYVTYFASFLFLLIGFIRFFLLNTLKSFNIISESTTFDDFSFAYLTIPLLIGLSIVAVSENTNLRKKTVNLTGVLIYSPYLFVDHAYDAIVIGVGAHWCQYLALNYKVYFHNRIVDTTKIVVISFIALYAITMAVLGYKYHFDNKINLLILIPLSGQAFHYYADAFIWRFSDPHIRNVVGKRLFA